MNFPKLMVIVGVFALVIGAFVYFTSVDHSDPASVATAFTKAMKKQDTKAASALWVPEKADAWRTAMDAKIDGMKTGSFTSYFERIPADPVFTTPAGAAGTVTMQSVEQDITLELTQFEEKWYVSGSEL